eukprot:6947526-Pyramimonas_sp.AAC.3
MRNEIPGERPDTASAAGGSAPGRGEKAKREDETGEDEKTNHSALARTSAVDPRPRPGAEMHRANYQTTKR